MAAYLIEVAELRNLSIAASMILRAAASNPLTVKLSSKTCVSAKVNSPAAASFRNNEFSEAFELHPGAANDITEIWEFIAKDNPSGLPQLPLSTSLEAIRKLATFPNQGHRQVSIVTSEALRFQAMPQII